MPAPLPLPIPPNSTPLGSAALRPVPVASSSPARPANNGADVTVYDEQSYEAKPGDTFDSISKQFFLGSDKYAKALQLHNQNHARAGMEMSRSGKLSPGEKIYIPPSYILEQRYAGTIPKATSATPAALLPTGGTPPSP